jgi:hypothetical protein
MESNSTHIQFIEPIQKVFCESCAVSKSHKKTSRISMRQVTKRFQILHIDIDDSISENSHSRSHDFILFIYDFSQYIVVIFLKRKLETLQALKKFKNELETIQDGMKIETLRLDNGAEYISQTFSKFLKTNHIRYEPMAPYTPEENKVSECTNRTIVEQVRAMLHDVDLSIRF